MSAEKQCASLDLAVQWHLGELGNDEAQRFEAHLDACAECRAEVAALQVAASELALSGPQAEPPAELLPRLMERIGRGKRAAEPMPWNVWSDDAIGGQLTIARDGEHVWEPTPIAGIEARRLFVDRAQDRVTMLVRMAPGAAFPAHVHGGPEECFVLRGDLIIGPETMAAGDYQYAPPGSSHPIQSTRGGCVLLLTSSLSDERH